MGYGRISLKIFSRALMRRERGLGMGRISFRGTTKYTFNMVFWPFHSIPFHSVQAHCNSTYFWIWERLTQLLEFARGAESVELDEGLASAKKASWPGSAWPSTRFGATQDRNRE